MKILSRPWHPLLFGAVIVVVLWLDATVSPFAVFRSLAIVLIVAVALTAVGAVVLRSLELGAIAASAVIWLLWSKQLVDLWETAFDRLGWFALVWALAIGAVIGLVVRMALRRRLAWTPANVTSALNRTGALLLAAALLWSVVSGAAGSAVHDLDQGIDLASWRTTFAADGPSADQPDIYVILLDGYPRADVLEYAFDIDDTGFLDALADRGLEVATSAHSNYLWTHVTVPSALNLAYVEQIPQLEDVVAGRVAQQPTIRHAIGDNAAFDAVAERGYDTIAVASGFEQVAARQADVWVDGGQMNEFETSLLTSTFAGDLLNVVAPDFASSQQRARILGVLDALPEIAETRDRPPAFVYAHVPAPHQPTVFGEDGSPVRAPLTEAFYADSPQERDEDPEEFRERYRAQMPFVNERVVAAIDGILAASERPPIIVLFADHGSASRTDWNVTDPDTADPAALLERTGTLFASLTPGASDVFPDDVAPVDMLRLLFDAYFGTDYGQATPPEGGGQIEPVDASVLEQPPP